VRPTTGQPRAFSNQPKERRLGINTQTRQQQRVFLSLTLVERRPGSLRDVGAQSSYW
jgi:hypothetical protein